MSERYTEADLKRAEGLADTSDGIPGPEEVAQLIADVRAEARKAFAREVETLLRKHLQHGGDKVRTQLAIIEVDMLIRMELGS